MRLLNNVQKICHPERSEGSRPARVRFFAPLRSAQNDSKTVLFNSLYIVILFCCLASTALAQDVNFTASVDKNRISINDQVQLNLTVTGSQDVGTPELPSLDGFEVMSRGSSSQFSFINGKMSVSKSFSYILIPIKEGTLTIDPATVEAGGKIYSTDPLSIEVLPKGASPGPSPKKTLPAVPSRPPATKTTPSADQAGIKERIFIDVATDKEDVYIGEQIVMTFKLYLRDVRIDNLQYSPPLTKGFVTESMGPQKEYRETVGGTAYNVIELQTAIFPASSGALTIEPAKLKCDLLVKEQRRQRTRRDSDGFFDDFFDDSFFAPYSRYPLDLESNPVTITVKPLPTEGRPSSFRGAVGTYDLHVSASPKSVKAGEPINILMNVSGAGNISAVSEPVIENLKGFKTYESEVKTDITGRDPVIAGEKTFQKMIIPQNEKIKEIPKINLSYFDPVKEKYCAITKGPIPIIVQPAPEKDQEIVELIKQIAPSEEAEKAVNILAKDIQYIENSPGRLNKTGCVWYNNLLLWTAIVIFPVILFIFSLFYQSHRTRLRQDSAYAKIRSAYKAAVQSLKETAVYEKQNKSKEFYDTLAKTIQRYISDKLNLPPGTVSIDSLASRKIPQDIIDRTKSLLNTCDLARFGAASFGSGDMKNALKEVSNIIKILEKKI